MGITQSKNWLSLNELLYTLVIWMAVFVPGHLGGFVLEQIFVAVTVIIFGFIAANGSANGNYFNISKLGVVLFFILLEILYVASFFLSEARLLSGSVGIRDFFELSRYFIYFLFFFVVILTHLEILVEWLEC